MNQPISHKLAPFLEADLPEKAPMQTSYAGYFLPALGNENRKDFDSIKTSKKEIEDLQLENKMDFLKIINSKNFDLLLDIFCVDHNSCIKIYYLFQNSRLNYSFRLSLDIKDNFHMPSLSARYASAHWLERECFDLFGIYFEGHPHLKRLLLYPEFAGHPLRKNYPIDKAQPLIPIYA